MKNKEIMKNKISLILVMISIIISIYFMHCINNIGILPNKHLAIIYIVIILILILIILLITRKKIVFYILSIILILFTNTSYIIGSNYINKANKTLENISKKKITNVNYYIIVKKNSKINKISDLNNKTIGYIKDNNTKNLFNKLNKQINYNEKEYVGLSSIIADLENDTPIILNSGYIDALNSEIQTFKNSYKIIYTITLNEKNDNMNSYKNINKESFILYISGIDTYGKISTRGRSDVNILAVVNPNTKKILLVNTPRDYYVQLHDTTGLKDKLTHAGIYGIEKSIQTMEDIYDINIDKYLRVNFNTLIKLVDEIGGIDINSDEEFTAYTDKNVTIKKGINHLNGKEALAYSRERYTYTSGDKHRGENQQEVISAIIKKITQKNTLMQKYDTILKTLSNSFETNITDKEIKDFSKMQLNKNIKWEIESISVDGTNSRNYTYSMGTNYLLYVMIPDRETVINARNNIYKTLNDK